MDAVLESTGGISLVEANALRYKAARIAIRRIDRWIDRILTVLLLIILFIGIWFAYDSYYVFNGSTLGDMASYKPSSGADAGIMKELSKDVVAWLTIDDTKIDYPVMQGSDNNEYLNKNPYGDYSLSGSIFLDSYNAPDFSDPYNLVYGHHMSGGYMFGALDKFKEQDYFDAHRTGKLITTEGKEYQLEVFAFLKTDASKGEVFDLEAQYDRLGFIRYNSQIFEEPQTYQILALSTCKSPLTTERTILLCSMIEAEE